MARRVVDDDMRRYYDKRAPEYDDWWLGRGLFAGRPRPGWSEEVDELISLIGALPPARTLDVACGTGLLPRHLLGEVVALDQSDAMLDVARARMPDVRGGAGRRRAAPLRRRRVRAGLHEPLLRAPGARGAESFLNEARRVGGQLVIVDSALRDDVPPEEYQQRVLNDGSRHTVYKRFFAAEELADELGRGRVLHAGRWFVRSHAALVRAHADRALAVAHLDVEAELALVLDLAQLRGDRAGGTLGAAATCLMQTSKPTVALPSPRFSQLSRSRSAPSSRSSLESRGPSPAACRARR